MALWTNTSTTNLNMVSYSCLPIHPIPMRPSWTWSPCNIFSASMQPLITKVRLSYRDGKTSLIGCIKSIMRAHWVVKSHSTPSNLHTLLRASILITLRSKKIISTFQGLESILWVGNAWWGGFTVCLTCWDNTAIVDWDTAEHCGGRRPGSLGGIFSQWTGILWDCSLSACLY
jgi:hypothetical protein